MAKANVQSIESMRRFEQALRKFEDEASSALDSIKYRSERTKFWLRNDLFKYWKGEEKKWEMKMQQAKQAYAASKMGGKPGNLADKNDMRRAKQHRDYAHEKIEKIRKWVVKLDRELVRETSLCIRLSTLLRNRCPEAKHYIAKLIEHLEKYQTDTIDFPSFLPEESSETKGDEEQWASKLTKSNFSPQRKI